MLKRFSLLKNCELLLIVKWQLNFIIFLFAWGMRADEMLFVVALNNEVDLDRIGFTKATNSLQGDMSRRICEVAVSCPAPLNIYHHKSGARLLITGIGKVNATYALLDFIISARLAVD